MRQDRDSEEIVKDHRLVHGLTAFLKRNQVPKELVAFLRSRVCFAYPKTLWIKFAADAASDVKVRHALDPQIHGNVLRKWIQRQNEFRRIAFDLRGITIVDLTPLLEFFEIISSDLPFRFYVCDPPLTPLLVERGVDPHSVSESEKALIQRLRNDHDHTRQSIRLRASLTGQSLESALKKYATQRCLASSDLVEFDMTDVIDADFSGVSLLPAIIHSLAHRHGALARVFNPRRKLIRTFERFGIFRVVAGYVIDSPEFNPTGESEYGATLPMHVFTHEELDAVIGKDGLVDKKVRWMLGLHDSWLRDLTGLPEAPRKFSAIEEHSGAVQQLMHLIKELAENAATHSQGLGACRTECGAWC